MNYVVIFKAKIKHTDEEYQQLAQQLREKALTLYHCQKFENYFENGHEVSLSYWLNSDDIHAWHHDQLHQYAQQQGKMRWYESFSIEVCQIQRAYSG